MTLNANLDLEASSNGGGAGHGNCAKLCWVRGGGDVLDWIGRELIRSKMLATHTHSTHAQRLGRVAQSRRRDLAVVQPTHAIQPSAATLPSNALYRQPTLQWRLQQPAISRR